MKCLGRTLSAILWIAISGFAAPISYSSYLGAAGIDSATAVAVDSSGCILVAGWTESGGTSGVDAFVTKLSPDGKTVIWSTPLSASGTDQATSIAVSASGDVYVAGWTNSLNFPVQNAFQGRHGGARDAFLAKLTSSGAVAFITYFGGSGNDAASGIALDSAGNIYIAGETTSPDLPVKNALQANRRGGTDAFVAKFVPAGNALVFATYVGGALEDRANAIAVDTGGNAYVTGDTSSSDFPVAGALQAASGGGQDAFVLKLNPLGSLVYSTYLGGSGGAAGLPESGKAIAVDSAGNAYVAGVTSSKNFPVAGAAQPSPGGGTTDGFVVKLNPAGSSLVYSTYLGGASVDYCTAIALDAAGAVWVAGYTASANMTMKAPAQGSNAGLYDAFLVQLASNGSTIEQSTYLGGSASDSAYAIGIAAESIYVAGQTGSSNFPLKEPVQASLSGMLDGFITRYGEQKQPEVEVRGARFVPITPCRVLDTRNPAGPFGGPAFKGGDTRSFEIPAGGCGIPPTAIAYAANLAVVPHGKLGFVTIWPTGKPLPVASTLNSFDGRVKANAVLIPAGTAGAVSIYASDPTDVFLDINGYFVPATSTEGLAFYPVVPCRIMDTRWSNGPLGGPSLAGGSPRNVPVRSSPCGIPATARAYSLNLTAIPHGSLPYLSAWPGGKAQPAVSTLNAYGGQVTANAAVIEAGPDGSINVFASHNADVLVDINGYFAPPGPGGLSFYPVTPCRIADTRDPSGPLGPAFQGLRPLAVAQSPCGLPVAEAYSLNATVIPRGRLSYLNLWPSGEPQPGVSTLNAFDGAVTSNAAIVPATGGSINVFTTELTDLFLDANGYFAP
ncbi:MAG TPA: SBBP repeat-containing protein [Bryobacteraceae bacterium]|nr:SBBP repeat-containing protein [Bryobacteraceae bacterium]HPQ15172.1 SBBP repeat-containing protein [Bryobacteraceae bacterium]